MARPTSPQHACGFSCWHPQFLQRFANYRVFMAVYGLLGTIQAMAYMYFLVTLPSIEKRFKIPSQTMGIVLSGNEISQILLSLILSYIGGQRNRPRWIAWGCVFCGLSCYILALPHFIYGAGEETLKLTKEYWDDLEESHVQTASQLMLLNVTTKSSPQMLCGDSNQKNQCESYLSVLPLVLIFLSQFVLGIGNTLYYSLGQTYLDDNTKKKNTPILMAFAMALRMMGPMVGFPLAYLTLNVFVDPTKTPLISRLDPRWLGAWWLGWMVIGTGLIFLSGLLGIFPKELPKPINKENMNSHVPHALRFETVKEEEGLPLGSAFNSTLTLDVITAGPANELPTFKNFPKALMRLLRNKLLIYNIVSSIFYTLGAGGYMTFMTKYMEVQFHKNSQDATIVAGPMAISGIVVGTLISGTVISKYKPSASKVLMWNVVVGAVGILGEIAYMFYYCSDSVSIAAISNNNFTTGCNQDCSCISQAYAPVCDVTTDTTYFSACHAGCTNWDADSKLYYNCSCLASHSITFSSTPLKNSIQPGICTEGCGKAHLMFFLTSATVNFLGSSGRIGNLLVNYRSVSTLDKSFAQGLLLMMLSLFSLIPGPIIFGRVIDSTCLLWTETCNGTGNCQLYDQAKLRYYMNGLAAVFTSVGVLFDIFVWKHGKNLDLYGEKEASHAEEMKRRHKVRSPLLSGSENEHNHK